MPGTADAYQDTRTQGQLGPACPAALDLEAELKGGLGSNFDLIASGAIPESCGTTAACLPHGEREAKRMGFLCHVCCCAMLGPSWHFSQLASHAQARQILPPSCPLVGKATYAVQTKAGDVFWAYAQGIRGIWKLETLRKLHWLVAGVTPARGNDIQRASRSCISAGLKSFPFGSKSRPLLGTATTACCN